MNLAETIFLLALDREKGIVKPELERALDAALAGAVLMDLALSNRVDTDLTLIRVAPDAETSDPLLLRVVSKEPVGDRLLDECLTSIGHKPDPRPTGDWIGYFSSREQRLRGRVAESLAGQKRLAIEDERKFLFFKSRRYRVADSAEADAVRQELRKLLTGDDIPDPREAVLVSLASACGLVGELLAPDERERARPRIEALRKLDLIGQATARLARAIESNIASA